MAVKSVIFITALLVTAMLSGCETISNFMGGEDNSEPPAPLVEFTPTADVVTRWSRNIGDGSDELYLKLNPAVTEDSIYVTSRNGDITALNSANGSIRWSRDTDEPLASAAGVGEELVLAGTSTGRVVALDKANGEILWNVRMSSEVLAAPQVDNNIVVVRSVDGKLAGLDSATGERMWIFDRSVPALSLRGNSAPVIHEGLIIAGFDEGRVAAIELNTGRAIWEARIAIGSGRSDLERMVDINATPVIHNSVAYVSTYQGRVAAVDITSGRVLWDRNIPSYAGLSVHEGSVYVTADNGHIWALDVISGNSQWHQDALQARAISAPVRVGPYVVVGDVEGYVHWLDYETGEFAARINLDESPIIATPVSIDETVYFYTTAGKLVALGYR
ncbi:MAG: outer membrane protein assembly factor BamB [Gammaproteobacteria bacterium]